MDGSGLTCHNCELPDKATRCDHPAAPSQRCSTLLIQHYVLEIFNSLAPLQTLKHLSLDVTSSSIERNMAKNACPALLELSLSGNDHWIHHVLDSLAGGQIKTVTIATSSTNSTTLTELYRSLARLSSLQKISHSWGDECEMYWDSASHSMECFKVEIIPIIYPISRLSHLECLELSSWTPFTDHDILALATTFPTIKELGISSGVNLNSRRPTFNSLCSIASTCLNLTSLTISLDLTTLPSSVVPSFCPL